MPPRPHRGPPELWYATLSHSHFVFAVLLASSGVLKVFNSDNLVIDYEDDGGGLHLNDRLKRCLLSAHMSDEAVAKQQCKTLMKMKMMPMLVQINIVVKHFGNAVVCCYHHISPLVSVIPFKLLLKRECFCI